jgi:hypothetical protein
VLSTDGVAGCHLLRADLQRGETVEKNVRTEDNSSPRDCAD